MNRFFSVVLFVLFFAGVQVHAQTDTIHSALKGTHAEIISILNVFPHEYPQVSVVFKIEDQFGNPVWNLKPKDLEVQENGQACNILSLQPVSKRKPISISLVMDHSGSMQIDEQELINVFHVDPWFIEIDSNGLMILPTGYLSPWEKARRSVKDFVNGFDCKKDYFSVVGFSTKVKEIVEPVRDPTIIIRAVDAMKPDSLTALYDAIMEGIRQADRIAGIKATVVLTDGNDNSSESTVEDVIAFAQKKEIPIFIIGLGDVNKDTLKTICSKTKGDFFYIQTSTALPNIYTKISRKIQSYYDLVYQSENLSLTDTGFNIMIRFKEDGRILETDYMAHVSEEVKSYLTNRALNKQYIIWGGIATTFLLLGGTLIWYNRKRKTKKIAILRCYPNPVREILNLELSHSSGYIAITAANGMKVINMEVTDTSASIDVSSLPRQVYFVYFTAEGDKTEAIHIVKQ